jgi:hypothetical protein
MEKFLQLKMLCFFFFPTYFIFLDLVLLFHFEQSKFIKYNHEISFKKFIFNMDHSNNV